MTANRYPYEHALAERMNGIIKTEFNLHSSSLNFEQTHELVLKSVESYSGKAILTILVYIFRIYF